jgi:hypothetical protein
MHEDIRYEKHFLKEVIVRIDFVAPLDELTKSLPQKVAKVASQQFPIVEPTEGLPKNWKYAWVSCVIEKRTSNSGTSSGKSGRSTSY